MNLRFGSGAAERRHATDEDLLSFLDGELPVRRANLLRRHLEHCWTCRARRDELEAVIDEFVAYRRNLVAPYLPPPTGRRRQFLKKIEEASAGPANSLARARQESFLSGWARFSEQKPILLFAELFAVASLFCFFYFFPLQPSLHPQQFLDRASAWDPGNERAREAGIVYQKVTIRLPGKTIRVSHYRDAIRKRRLKPRPVSMAERPFRDGLERNGIDWEQPLSAENFAAWRNHQRSDRESVETIPDGLLKLTITSLAGPVAQESLTVRGSDFHPIERTVLMRNEQTVQIAEVEYAVLPWDSVDAGLFEPLSGPPPAQSLPALRAARSPAAASPEQIDEAELASYLVLNRLHEDSSGRIRVERTANGVRVSGVVESEGEKRVLVRELRQISNVTPVIQTFQEAQNDTSLNEPISSVESGSLVGAPTPLERYLVKRGETAEQIGATSQRLLDSAVEIDHEARAINDLQTRFANRKSTTWALENSLDSLLKQYRERLLSSAREQAEVMNALGQSIDVPGTNEASGRMSELNAASVRDFSLTKELLSSDASDERDAAELLSQLRQILLDVRSATLALQPILPSTEQQSAASRLSH